jgi:hypothetical protein
MPDSDDDALFAALENEDDTHYRDQRIHQLKLVRVVKSNTDWSVERVG